MRAPKRETRLGQGRIRQDALFPIAPSASGLPKDYAEILADIKQGIRQERLRTVLAANSP
jgi:hypothetical protein